LNVSRLLVVSYCYGLSGGIVIARSETTKQSRNRRAPQVPLDCFAIARPEGRASFDALWLAITILVGADCILLWTGDSDPLEGENSACGSVVRLPFWARLARSLQLGRAQVDDREAEEDERQRLMAKRKLERNQREQRRDAEADLQKRDGGENNGAA
jgi:hypothetical protein